MKKEKGFTLIELLSVIIILGILMLLAVPNVTQYITDSRKSTYLDIIEKYREAVNIKINMGTYKFNSSKTTYYVNINDVELEQNDGKTPYGDFVRAYVVVTYSNDNYRFYWTSIDESGYRVDLKEIKDLTEDDIKPSSNRTIDKVPVEGKETIRVIGEDA